MKFSKKTRIVDLLRSEAAKTVLEKHIPGFISSPMIEAVKPFPLEIVARISRGKVTQEMVEAIDQDLSAIEELDIDFPYEEEDMDSDQILDSNVEFMDIMIPMRDGVKLRTRIALPKHREGPVPVLLFRTPYNNFKMIEKYKLIDHTRAGYASVHQQCRGTFGSEGEWVPNEYERQDGIDTLNWLVEQEWCGPIGIYGDSYQALTGWLVADSLPEKVKSLYLLHYSVDRFLSAYKQGLFRHDVLTGWAMGNSGKAIQADYLESARYRPHINVDEELWGVRLDWYRQWITSTDADDEYWNSGVWKILTEIPEKINVPVCLVASWYDHHLEGNLLGYEKLSDETKRKSRLVIGGWSHFKTRCIDAHPFQEGLIDFDAHMLEWFDGILKEAKEPESSVEAYSIGDDTWFKLNRWPIESGETHTFYLTDLRQEDGQAYRLDANMNGSQDSGVIEYRYNPDDPLYTNGGESLLTSIDKIGSKLQPNPGFRDDVISFVTDVLDEDVRIGGRMNVKLYVSSDCEDTSFTARVMEILPNGEAYNIRSSISTLAYRNNSRSRLDYHPEEIVEINIDLLPIIWNVKAGSRLRVDISSSNFPEYSIHSNYPGIWSLQDKTKIARQRIFVGGQYPSILQIPVLKV